MRKYVSKDLKRVGVKEALKFCDYAVGEYEGLNRNFSNLHWFLILQSSHVSCQVSLLTALLQQGMDKYTSLRRPSNFPFPLWFSRELRSLLKHNIVSRCWRMITEPF